jgi:hypothetical protein
LRELSLISPKNARGEIRLYLAGFSRKIGQNMQNHGIPIVLEIKESKANVHIIRNPMSYGSNIVPAIGQALVKNSQRGNNGIRLVNLMVDQSAASFLCRQISHEDIEENKP